MIYRIREYFKYYTSKEKYCRHAKYIYEIKVAPISMDHFWICYHLGILSRLSNLPLSSPIFQKFLSSLRHNFHSCSSEYIIERLEQRKDVSTTPISHGNLHVPSCSGVRNFPNYVRDCVPYKVRLVYFRGECLLR